MVGSILEYLSEPNPILDNDGSLPGVPTTIAALPDVTGMHVWTEFTYETMMNLYKHILLCPLPRWPEVSPPLTRLERQIFDEDSLEHLLSRAIMPKINHALDHAWKTLFREDSCPEISRGGRATKLMSDDPRLYPDWAGVYMPIRTDDGGLKNLCPGDTKLFTKWTMSEAISERGPLLLPIRQVQNYCEELVVFRVARQEIDIGIASTRPRRDPPQLEHQKQGHRRIISTASADTHISIDRASTHTRDWSMTSSSVPSRPTDSYKDDEHPIMDYKPIEYRSIPWTNSGNGVLTVKLALWWLHMMAAAPGCDTSVQTEYPPLDSWVTSQNIYRHSSAGITAKSLPKGARLISTDAGQSEQSTTAPGPSRMASESAQRRASPPSIQQHLPLRQRPGEMASVSQESQTERARGSEKGKGRKR
ncbi:hypothetical protein PHISCL_09576 [Aspergillus sclerotialis]|uniref:Uncharacterized protein n=1 Tax=Aspergillus sclerotialis TaxID=2070753 RepID=A0A3A2ZJP5_9EURO|nr:hypothetical protein PHISCL_09576 [Aspergillus sclerotialis]